MGLQAYIACPFCGWVRPLEYGYSASGNKRTVSFDKIDPGQVKVIQIRELSGSVKGEKRGGHIRIVESKTLSMLDEQAKAKIRNQCQKILDALK